MSENEQMNAIYSERNKCVALIAKLVRERGWPVSIKMNDEPGWHVVFIYLPTGQVSWHIQDSELEWFDSSHFQKFDVGTQWDGHTTEEKYERVLAYARK